MHEIYRSNFNAADVYNKYATGPDSLARHIGVAVWWKRAFMGFLSFCETNAYLAYLHTVDANMTRWMFRERLAYMLEHFGGETCVVAEPSLTGTSGSSVGRHAHLTKCDWKLKCVVCGRLVQTRCTCGKGVCNPSRWKEGCFEKHIMGIKAAPRKRSRSASGTPGGPEGASTAAERPT